MKNIEDPQRFIELYRNAQKLATACGTHVPRQSTTHDSPTRRPLQVVLTRDCLHANIEPAYGFSTECRHPFTPLPRHIRPSARLLVTSGGGGGGGGGGE